MAGLIRLNNLLACANRSSSLLGQVQRSVVVRAIATSPKNKDTVAAPTAECAPKAAKQENKNWVSYGFDFRDQANDKSAMRASYFFSVTLCLVWGTFVWAYLPDPQLRDWAQREAHLALRQREAAGLEPISRDYINPALITLPSEEDLAGVEIII